MTTAQMHMPIDQTPDKENTRPFSLLYILSKFGTWWELPPHQREFIWSDEKKAAWVERLDSPKPPIGQVLTYQLVDSYNRLVDPKIYINDGS